MALASDARRVLFRHVISPFTERVLRPGAPAAYRKLEAFERLGPDVVREVQWAGLRSFLAQAAATVPYYRQAFGELGLAAGDFASPAFTPETFARLPILTKPDVRRGFPTGLVSETERARRRPPWSRVRVFRTSGTTGLPLKFYRDPAMRPYDQALRRRQYAWGGLVPGDQIVHVRVTVYVSLGLYPFWSFFNGTRLLPPDLTFQRDGRAIARLLDDWRPEALVASPPSLALAAQALQQAGLRLRHPPKAIFAGGEAVDAATWRLFAAAFEAPVHVQYGANEFGIYLAQSCPDRVAGGEPPFENLHISASRFYVEVVDDEGRPVEPGREGRIIVTDLGNRLMPFIRYDIGDRGSLAPGLCPCGRGLPLLASLSGRSVERLILPSGKRLAGSVLAWALGGLQDLMWEFQFRQTAPNQLEVLVVPNPGVAFGASEQEAIIRVLRDLLGEPMVISVRVLDLIPRDPSGKRPLLKTLPGGEMTIG
jgi:phenylacetate-CoA ligase